MGFRLALHILGSQAAGTMSAVLIRPRLLAHVSSTLVQRAEAWHGLIMRIRALGHQLGAGAATAAMSSCKSTFDPGTAGGSIAPQDERRPCLVANLLSTRAVGGSSAPQ